jgi:hypothetical protein
MSTVTRTYTVTVNEAGNVLVDNGYDAPTNLGPLSSATIQAAQAVIGSSVARDLNRVRRRNGERLIGATLPAYLLDALDDEDSYWVVGIGDTTLAVCATHDEAAAAIGKLPGHEDGRYFLDGPCDLDGRSLDEVRSEHGLLTEYGKDNQCGKCGNELDTTQDAYTEVDGAPYGWPGETVAEHVACDDRHGASL